MNFRFVFNQLGLLCAVLSGVLTAMAIASGVRYATDPEVAAPVLGAFLISAAVAVALWLGCWGPTRKGNHALGRREALLLVAMSWFLGAGLAGLPFFLWSRLAGHSGETHPFHSAVNCYFEAMSGLTTTGATILTGIDLLPPTLLVWRALTQWLGGLGIVVLFVAVLPSLGVGGKRLFRVEAPGPEPEGVRPHIRETARILWLIYLSLTVLEFTALCLAGMNAFDALCHTLTTLATGGFSTRDASIGGYQDLPGVIWIVTVFMMLAGVNFGLYYQLIRRRVGSVFRDVELRVYLGIILFVVIVVVGVIRAQPIWMTDGAVLEASWWTTLRESLFTVVSLQTTTGFCTADFHRWPFLAKALLLLVMFVGGCAGSTGGGIKVIRVIIAFKVMVSELERVFRPTVVRPVRLGGTTISEELRLGSVTFLLGYILLFGAGTGALRVLEAGEAIDLTTAASATVATLCNVGPGLGMVGAVENYGWFGDPSKCVMILLMAIGRLELFAVLVLFSPRFWKSS